MKPRPLISIVTPAFNEAANLPVLYERLKKILDDVSASWEWIVVDDHSSDDTFGAICRLAENDRRIRAYRLAHNSGSHLAIGCALDKARAECAVVMAADLQDPPEIIPTLLENWRAGAQVVWAVRRKREGETKSTLAMARLFYTLIRKLTGLKAIPERGADFFLLDRRVIKALRQFPELNANLLILIAWMGFRQTSVEYDKQARLHGQSGWNLDKKLKLVVDSVTSFTYRPIRWMTYLGFSLATLGFLYAGLIVASAFRGDRPQGWSSLMVVVLVLGGTQIAMMGVLGEYLWRALEESRRRPRYLIEASKSASLLSDSKRPGHLEEPSPRQTRKIA